MSNLGNYMKRQRHHQEQCQKRYGYANQQPGNPFFLFLHGISPFFQRSPARLAARPWIRFIRNSTRNAMINIPSAMAVAEV